MGRVYAVLGDIHANIDALNAVLDDARAQGVTHFVCVGDVVGYNAAPAACIRAVRDELGCPCVRGNHDHYVSDPGTNLADFHPSAAQVVEWTRSQLAADDVQWLHDLPLQKPVMGFMLVHATLDKPDHWGYVFENQQAEANFSYQYTPLCFHGHTHVPIIYSNEPGGVVHYQPRDFTLELGQRLFINVGRAAARRRPARFLRGLRHGGAPDPFPPRGVRRADGDGAQPPGGAAGEVRVPPGDRALGKGVTR